MSAVAFVTLLLRSGIAHPLHDAVAILAFAAIYIGIGALIGSLVSAPLEGSLLVVLVFALDVFSGPQMTSSGGSGLAIFAALFWLTARRGTADPVCGMKVDRHKAVTKQVAGQMFYFCSEHCLHTSKPTLAATPLAQTRWLKHGSRPERTES